MIAKIEIELAPFTVPNYVLVKETSSERKELQDEARKFHVSEIDADTLYRMCMDFTDEVFKKANKTQPTRQG